MSKYYWIITDVGNGLGLDEDVGTSSHDSKKNWESRPHQQFKMYDDDGILYYKGTIFGEYDGFEPLENFGMSNAGCTDIQYKNIIGEWESL